MYFTVFKLYALLALAALVPALLIKALARDVFSDHVLAFELTSVLLVIAVVATVMLARKPRKGDFVVETKGGAK